MKDISQGDLFAGRELRDQGIESVTENSKRWQDEALQIIAGAQFFQATGEELRAPIVAAIGEPHHPNAWGALINTALKRGLIAKTGRYTQMRRASAHARVNAIYRKAASGPVS